MIARLICILTWALGLVSLMAASGDLDKSFGTNGVTQIDVVPGITPGSGNGSGTCMALQADQKIVVGGSVFNGHLQGFGVARYLANGTLDATFGEDGRVVTRFGTASGAANGIGIQPDQKIVVAGSAGGDFTVVRYLPDGSLDKSFSDDGRASVSLGSGGETVTGMALQQDGGIVVVGYLTNSGVDRMGITRFLTNGTLDSSFGTGGSIIFDFGGSSRATCVAIQTDGKIVLGGATTVGQDMALARCNPDGSLDPTFGSGGKVTTSFGSYTDYGLAVTLQTDGKILLGGYTAATALATQSQSFALARFLSNGSLDPSFGSGGTGRTTAKTGLSSESIRSLAVMPDGAISAVGYTVANYGSPTGNRVIGTASFDANGGLLGMNSFGSYLLEQEGYASALQSAGSLVVAGYHFNGKKNEFMVCRLAASNLDQAFGSSGYAYTQMSGGEDTTSCAALAPDGKIYAAGSTWAGLGTSSTAAGHDFAIVRLTASGVPDTTFSVDGIQTTSIAATDSTDKATALVVQSDGKPVVIGSAYDGTTMNRAMVRYLANGNLDTTFGTGGKATMAGLSPTAGAIQSNGRILVIGPVRVVQNSLSTQRFLITRHLTNGALDTSFGNSGSATVIVSASSSANDLPYAAAVQADGRILVAGSAAGQACVIRLLPNGSLDGSFDGDGKVITALGGSSSVVRAVTVQADGRILVAGNYFGSGGNSDFALARYLSDGSLDPSFGSGGIATTVLGSGDDQVRAMTVDGGGRIVVSGYSTVAGLSHFAVARYLGNGRSDSGFGGTGFVIQPLGFARSESAGVVAQSNGSIIAVGTALREYDFDMISARFEGGPEISVETAAGSPIASGTASSFGAVTLGSSRGMTFRIRNQGSSTLNLGGLTVGPPAVGFTVITPPAATVAPGGVTTFELGFAPLAAVAVSATVRLPSNDDDESSYELPVSGAGNRAPTWSGYAVACPWQTPVSISVVKLLAKASDADQDALTITAIGPASFNGGRAILQNSAIIYTPSLNFTGIDTFPLSITDARGASVTGTVTVTVRPPPDAGGAGSLAFNPPKLTSQPDGAMGISFHGIPGRTYQIQRSTDLSVWNSVATVTASDKGAIIWTDPTPPQPNGFYRLALP